MKENRTFIVPVRFSGRIEYEIQATDEADAMKQAEELASEETRLGCLSDIDFEAKPPTESY